MSRHRYVTEEPEVPFELRVIYEDSAIIVVDKPHFLATTPRGMWYRQTALIRLRERYGEPQITPAHRLDRMTAGVVLFVRDPAFRGAYQKLFERHRVEKTYECLAPARPISRPRTGIIERLEPPAVFPLRRRSHIVKERRRLQAYEKPGEVNAETVIELGKAGNEVEHSSQDSDAYEHVIARLSCCSSSNSQGLRRYVLHPRTGKTHQLRVHMNSLGLPIEGDDLYPRIVEPDYADFSRPLELVARRLSFVDPVSGEPRVFVSRVALGVGR
ncbi:tRNA pseudouridine32 synthase / 23S rRNA pseudouridine746 synthase [Bifidobacterium bohemicum]|uniref:RNA pseudouridylate synthase n=1 Tax=Bifidobacterium bohemicum DSM 22767 TaxID=1437606 RepID=A0A086ZK57_9BIFI|nr:pseudouridine synthase [Bifidobacterium bohemicum]KFI46907.1 RNA pseudouridylate synthase [Bifidobacterium bohemicum DSM 22767]SCB84625.1 tRNA pseudouridine32 synthase / 23S rRNA pseudouridine746 synthase [Bifidobacterium bohemicum]